MLRLFIFPNMECVHRRDSSSFFFLEQRSILGTVVYFVVSCSEMGALRDATCKYNLTLRVYCPFLVPPLLLNNRFECGQITWVSKQLAWNTLWIRLMKLLLKRWVILWTLDLDSTFCIRNFNAVLCFNSRRHFNSDVNGPFFHVCAAWPMPCHAMPSARCTPSQLTELQGAGCNIESGKTHDLFSLFLKTLIFNTLPIPFRHFL